MKILIVYLFKYSSINYNKYVVILLFDFFFDNYSFFRIYFATKYPRFYIASWNNFINVRPDASY